LRESSARSRAVRGERRGGEADRGAVVDDPVGALGEGVRDHACGANGKDAASSGFAGADAGRGVFDDDAVSRGNGRERGSGEIGFGIRLTTLDCHGGDEMADEIAETCGARRTSARGRVAEVTTANWLGGMGARSSRAREER